MCSGLGQMRRRPRPLECWQGGVEPLVKPLAKIKAEENKTLTVRGLEAYGWHAVGADEPVLATACLLNWG